MTSRNKWTRQLGDQETRYYYSYLRNVNRVRCWLVLNSRQPLEQEHIRTTIIHSYRKIPTLRLCIQRRNGVELWFKEMEKETVILKQYEEVELEKESKKSLVEEFDIENGPLWLVKIFPSSQHCPIAEIAEEYPHQYNVFIVFHHCITDGMSNVWICNHFLNMLNDVLDNKAINRDQFSFHGSPNDLLHITKPLLKQIDNHFSHRFKKVKDSLKMFDAEPNLLIKEIDMKADQLSSSCCHTFTIGQTHDMIMKCKKNGITVNSFMSTAINVSIYKLLQLSPLKGRKNYKIPNIQLVNTRRYFKDPNKESFGLFAPGMSNMSTVHSDSDENFWNVAKDFDTEMKARLDNYGPIEEELYHRDMIDKECLSDQTSYYNYYYMTSNLGNITKEFSGTGKHVQATSFREETSFCRFNCIIEMHTFRGRLFTAIDYWPPLLKKKKACKWLQILVDTVVNILNK